jgi:PAS domain S-box-containing protein
VKRGQRAAAYVLAVLAVAGTALLRWLLGHWLGEAAPLLLFMLPVSLAAWWGGLGPGAAATLLSVLVGCLLFLHPIPGEPLVFGLADRLRLLLFVLTGLLVSWLYEALLEGQRGLQKQRERLQGEIAARRAVEKVSGVEGRGLELVLGLAGMGSWDWDLTRGMVAWSESCFTLLGLPLPGRDGREVPIRQWAELVHPDDVEQVTGALDASRRNGTPYTQRFRMKRADTGDVVWVDVNGRFLYDDHGQAVRQVGVFRDVTAQVSAEENLKESERRFRTLADHVPVLIWMNGPEGCEFVNREFLNYFGLPMEKVLGMQWAQAVHPEDLPAYRETYERAWAARSRFIAQVRLRRADGAYRWFKSIGVPRMQGRDRFQGYVGCSLDITDIKRSEESLQEADRQKDEFLAVLAHELRNPLVPLRNGIFLMQRAGDEPATRQKALDLMQRQVGLLTRLVDDLLDVSRVTQGKLDLRHERVGIDRVIRDAIETVRPLMESLGHALEVHLPGEPVQVQGDPVRLAQIFSNLLNNAAKFTPPEGRISISARHRNGSVLVSVRDTGEGIPREALGRIFGMFDQLQPAGTPRKGLGIGLALVKRLVHLHGGEVEARSEGPGRGSEFTVRLPAVAVGAACEERQDAGAGESAPRPLVSCRVLIVDDNDDVLVSLENVVRVLGCDIRTARDGETALDEGERFKPNIVLMDLGMPGMDGLETGRRMRQRAWGRRMLLVAVTGWGRREDRRRSKEAGFDHHMVKPVDPAALAALLLAVNRGEAQGGTASPPA